MVYDATLEEYEAVVGTYLDEAGDAASVVPGIGPGFGRALEMGHIARSLGVAGVMIMPVVGPALRQRCLQRIQRDCKSGAVAHSPLSATVGHYAGGRHSQSL